MAAKYGQLLGVAGAGGGSDSSLVATNDVLSTPEDTPLVSNVLTNDTTEEGSLSVLWFRVRTNGDDPGETTFDAGVTGTISGVGTLRINANGALSFTPNADFFGAVPMVSYMVTNGHSVRIGTVSITVTEANDAPVASPDARITLVNTPITFNLLGNDYDPDDDSISVSHIDDTPVSPTDSFPKAGGTLVYDGSGQVTFTPAADFTGSVSFDYTITDGELSDSSTITILVGAANEPLFSAAAPIAGTQGVANFNFGLTYRGLYGAAYNNGVNVSVPPYSGNQGLFDLNNREPWLYDRASTVYALYLRTQDPTILDQAFTLADLYMAGVDVTAGGLGRFVIVGGAAGADVTDIKYLYPIISEWYEKEKNRLSLPNADAHRAKGIALYRQALASFSKTYNPTSAALWTERNVGYAIQASVAAHYLYRRAGNLSASLTALQDAWDYFAMVEGMSASGAPLHGHNQHEGSAITTPISSPWMSGFLAESLLQLYRADPDDSILTWLSNYGDWIIANAVYVTDGSELAPLAGLRLPAYLAANNATPITFREGELLDMEHAADVAALMRKVLWAKTELSLSTTATQTLIDELDEAADIVWEYWTRTTEGYPRYRVNPPRKGGWWFRNSYSDETLFFTGQVPTLPLNITNPNISGSSQMGSELTGDAPTWDGFPAPTTTYQWYRGASPIGGATSQSYTTVEADIGTAITRRAYGTNDGGVIEVVSNAINVVAAGAPEITVHPSNATREVGQTAQFTAECDASPTATFQWQVSTNGGSSWSNVVGGSGGSGTGNTTTYTTPVLASGDNGNLYRCGFTNVSGTVYTNSATLSMVVDQGAAEFTSNTSGAIFTFDIGDVGISDLVIEALIRFPSPGFGNSNFLGIRHSSNGRGVIVGMNNTFEVYALGPRDTQTGHTAWATQPPANAWVHVTLQCSSIAGGDQIRATWALAEGVDDTRTAATRANGVENSVQGQQVFVGGIETGPVGQGTMRVQHVRARTGNLADAVVDGHRHDTDTSGWAYWWKFVDAGGGALGVQDLTGNGRTPTITGGSFVAGPVVPGP